MLKYRIRSFILFLGECCRFIFLYINDMKVFTVIRPLWKSCGLKPEQKAIHARLELLLCPRYICKVLQDKSLTELIYASVPGLKFPKTVIINCSGIYYDGNRNIVNKAMAATYVKYWLKNADFIIKPTVAAPRGMSSIIYKKDGSCNEEAIEVLFEIYRNNFIIQECVTSNTALQALYEKQLNTILIMTYILDDRLYHAPLILKMGRENNEIGSYLYIGINEEGFLKREAYDTVGKKYISHPDSAICFDQYVIPNVAKVIDCAFACHKRTPHTKFITWEFTIDKNENPVLLEVNLLGHLFWFPQAVCGEGTFGSNAKRMLELAGIREITYKKFDMI